MFPTVFCFFMQCPHSTAQGRKKKELFGSVASLDKGGYLGQEKTSKLMKYDGWDRRGAIYQDRYNKSIS